MGTSLVNACPLAGSTLLIHVNFVILSALNVVILDIFSQSVILQVHLAAANIKSCNADSIKSSVPHDHLSLSTISKDSVESYSSSELNETQNHCETTVSNQSICQISHVIVPNMVFPNDSHISDEISYKSEGNMLSERNYD
ncbi:hypothetical protein MS3_00000927 [Schistosoma haematobium]|uniref:Uncharacterized protein n=1 Tax=Schistosoma haematobium TaxID=6185 RepID=A0A922LYF7_SCHHA|nr:hypothetical protein MS3_00000927 [Schistosoma haematobium]KAH9596459.1 hypothetical protein MS3_00000927 [Schistosoma haematobium]